MAASRIEAVRHYAETFACRRTELLAYFGEHYEPPCGNCDNCEAGLPASTSAAAPSSAGIGEDAGFPANARVVHAAFGLGEVLQVDGDRLTVLFDDVGYKTLSASTVAASELLRVLD